MNFSGPVIMRKGGWCISQVGVARGYAPDPPYRLFILALMGWALLVLGSWPETFTMRPSIISG